MSTIQKFASLFTFAFLPVFAFAAPNFNYFESATASIGALVSQLIPIAIAIGLLFFIWGLVQFIMSGGDDTAKEAAKTHMVWGVIALFVMVAVWGIVGLLGDITGVDIGGSPDLPTVGV